ncbi:hypothetical protein HO173_001123 [Letharia columbiana]|uniref:SET domain-containing protein n=1 Tax=Letharia columbiana TaxID=112416 RepID=A0A8H6G4W9_9LECA|nr:uncharacterized protein HO173_001123 [Letharia columbiana]KAF6240455.1 hypothetical protein HO173_001123 [Letharia columbiana]
MHRQTLPIDQLGAWARLNNVEFNGVKIMASQGDKGSGLVMTAERSIDNPLLMTIPNDLVLSLENVWVYAKSDKHLRQVLEATGDYSRTARGAILIFLLLQVTNGATGGSIGVSNPFSEYVKFLPLRVPLPTTWNESERAIVTGTSLEAAVSAKLNGLDREITLLKEKTSSIDWCQECWWDAASGTLTLDDWKTVDAMYRSRALDLPGTGHSMVPCIDMANHASGGSTSALYETDGDGNAILVLREGKDLAPNDEVTITYGDEKGACEMLFSYGFIESTVKSARELFLDLSIPDDDPLKLAKKAVAQSAPGFRLFLRGDSTDWESSFVWLLCVNEEDGLEIKLLQKNDGERELQASWKDKEITDMSNLVKLLKLEPLWDVFALRAIITCQNRVEQQLFRLEGSKNSVDELLIIGEVDNDIRANAMQLRHLEEILLLHAYGDFETKKSQILDSPVVQQYLGATMASNPGVSEDDFS